MFKGLAILGVIITHLVLNQNGTDGTHNDPSAIVMFLYSGLVMFVVVSGYFHKPGRSFAENLKKRVLPLLLIFIGSTVAMTLLMYVYELALGYDLSAYPNPLELIWTLIISKGIFLPLDSADFTLAKQLMAPYEVTIQMYYLQILVIGYIIFYLIADRVLKDWRTAVATILVLLCAETIYIQLVNIQLPFYMHLSPLFTAFLLLGALLSKYRFADFLENNIRDRRFWLGFGLLVLLALALLFFLPDNYEIKASIFGSRGILSVFIFSLVSFTCGMIQFFLAAILAKVPGVSAVFMLMGRNILYLFLLHMLVARMILAPFVTLGADVWIPLGITDSLILAFATIPVMLVLSYMYKRIKSKYLSRDANVS